MARLPFRFVLRTAIAGFSAALLAAGAILLEPEIVRHSREVAIDTISQLSSSRQSARVKVIDIDNASVRAMGEWPWQRSHLAELIEAVAAAHPDAIAVDLVLSGNCGTAVSDNRALAAALRRAPVTLGFVMSNIPGPPPAISPIALHRPVDIPDLWQSAGAEQPCAEFVQAAAGLATVSLAGDQSATVRSMPALVMVGQDLYPGLAVDAVRLGTGVGTLIVGGVAPATIDLGELRARLDDFGNLRLHASGPEIWAQRTFSAATVMSSRNPQLTGNIVIIGSSLPQLGGLRPTAASPLTPSSQIQADIASSLLMRALPWRPPGAKLIEAAAMFLAIALVVLAALWLRPLVAALAALGAAMFWPAAAAAAYHLANLAFDPLLPALGTLVAGIATGISQYSAAREAEANIRRSFEQRLPPVIVARLASEGASLKLEGEERIVTALFTDIEGFTAMTAAAGPRELIRLLDGYFEGVTRIVTDAGGMVDKIVGDAIHAFFNVPLDLDDHPANALACAEKIMAFSEEYRCRPDAKRSGFGRTRIGIETGIAVVGDVGALGKIDYTAYGDAVNMAARLQEANKQTGTSVLVGPGLKSSGPAGWCFESQGTLDMRGLGPVEVFCPRRLN